MLLTIDKSHEGVQIYAFGTYNSAKRHGVNPLLKVTVEKIGREYADLVFSDGSRRRVTLDGTGQHGHSYDLFRSVDDFKAYQLRDELAQAIRSGSVPSEIVLKLADALGVEFDASKYLA